LRDNAGINALGSPTRYTLQSISLFPEVETDDGELLDFLWDFKKWGYIQWDPKQQPENSKALIEVAIKKIFKVIYFKTHRCEVDDLVKLIPLNKLRLLYTVDELESMAKGIKNKLHDSLLFDKLDDIITRWRILAAFPSVPYDFTEDEEDLDNRMVIWANMAAAHPQDLALFYSDLSDCIDWVGIVRGRNEDKDKLAYHWGFCSFITALEMRYQSGFAKTPIMKRKSIQSWENYTTDEEEEWGFKEMRLREDIGRGQYSDVLDQLSASTHQSARQPISSSQYILSGQPVLSGQPISSSQYILSGQPISQREFYHAGNERQVVRPPPPPPPMRQAFGGGRQSNWTGSSADELSERIARGTASKEDREIYEAGVTLMKLRYGEFQPSHSLPPPAARNTGPIRRMTSSAAAAPNQQPRLTSKNSNTNSSQTLQALRTVGRTIGNMQATTGFMNSQLQELNKILADTDDEADIPAGYTTKARFPAEAEIIQRRTPAGRQLKARGQGSSGGKSDGGDRGRTASHAALGGVLPRKRQRCDEDSTIMGDSPATDGAL